MHTCVCARARARACVQRGRGEVKKKKKRKKREREASCVLSADRMVDATPTCESIDIYSHTCSQYHTDLEEQIATACVAHMTEESKLLVTDPVTKWSVNQSCSLPTLSPNGQ